MYNLAYFDPLTNLPNRRMLLDRLSQCIHAQSRKGSQGALVYLDIDQFKLINDAFGQHEGDRLLIEIGRCISSVAREEDTVAHLGADHFILLLTALSPEADEAAAQAEAVVSSLFIVLDNSITMKERSLLVTLSAGISLINGAPEDAEDILKRGELAMVEAKRQGRNSLRFFDPQMQARIDALVTLQEEIRLGLLAGQFQSYYQPKVDQTGRLVSVEALCRWQHPQRGFISPAEFIPVAEDAGLILLLGYEMLKRACDQLVTWSQRPETSDISIAVNVSAKQFVLPNFVEEVTALLKASGAPASRLVLEMTESRLAENIDDIINKINALHHYGVKFSLDDFGTGYSSLSYLRRLPIQELKIDRAFVNEVTHNRNDATLVKTIIAMGHTLGMKIVAEGVETPAQWEFLRRENCDLGQGYLFGKPVSIDELEATWLHAERQLTATLPPDFS